MVKEYFRGFLKRFIRMMSIQVMELIIIFIVANLAGQVLFAYFGTDIMSFMKIGDDEFKFLSGYGKEMRFIAFLHLFLICVYVITNLVELVDRYCYLFFNRSKHTRKKSM